MLDEFLNKAHGARNSKMLRSYILREILGKGKFKSSARNTKELNSNTPVQPNHKEVKIVFIQDD